MQRAKKGKAAAAAEAGPSSAEAAPESVPSNDELEQATKDVLGALPSLGDFNLTNLLEALGALLPVS